MKSLLAILITLFLVNGLAGQEVKSTKESAKEASRKKKAERIARIEEQFRLTDKILTGKRFVLEAQRLRNERGAQKFVSANLNFISVDSLHGIIQVGSPERAGYNGVGGITVDVGMKR